MFREGHENKFPTHFVTEFHAGDKALFRNHVRGVYDPRNGVAYLSICLMGW